MKTIRGQLYSNMKLILIIIAFGLTPTILKAQNRLGVMTDSAGNTKYIIHNNTPTQAAVTTTTETPAPAKPDTAWANPKAHYAMMHRKKQLHLQAMKSDSANKSNSAPSTNQSVSRQESGKLK